MKEKERVLGFWQGCACQLGGKIFPIKFPFFYDEFIITQEEFEEEVKEKKYIEVEERCGFCRGSSSYVLFPEKRLTEILKEFPYLRRLQKNYKLLQEYGIFERG
jgi:hypothetical protein